MSLTKNLDAYVDVQAVLDAARLSGVTTRFITGEKTQAIAWRPRAYMFRRLLVEKAKQAAGVEGFSPSTPYDGMMLTVSGSDAEGWCVLISFRTDLGGKLTTLEGEEIPVTLPERVSALELLNKPKPERPVTSEDLLPDDTLTSAIEEAAKNLGLK